MFLSGVGLARQKVRPGHRMRRVVEGLTVVAHRLPDGCCGAYYPEANPLVPPGARNPRSHTASCKAIPVRMRRLDAGAR